MENAFDATFHIWKKNKTLLAAELNVFLWLEVNMCATIFFSASKQPPKTEVLFIALWGSAHIEPSQYPPSSLTATLIRSKDQHENH